VNRLTLALLLIAVALTRLPPVLQGYGADPDAWRVASSASRLWTTGEYQVSRYPGYPLHEIISAPLVALGGAAASNGATLIVALLLLAIWNRIALREARHPAILVITLALTPLFLKNSVVTMDYIWSLFFLVLALDNALQKNALLAGVFVGLAAGFRMANLVALVPVGVLFLDQIQLRRIRFRRSQSQQPQVRQSPPDPFQLSQSRSLHPILMFMGVALGTTLLSYLPVILTLGLERWYAETAAQLASIRQHNDLGFRMFLYRSVYAFGPLAVIAAIGFLGARWKEFTRMFRSFDPLVWSPVAGIVVYSLVFFSLPLEREYLLPLVPFLLLLSDRFLMRSHLLLLLFCVITYAFINPDIVYHQEPVGRVQPNVRKGILLEDCEKRTRIAATRREILALTTSEKTIVVTGFPEPYWFNEEGVERIDSPFHEQLFRNRGTVRAAHIYLLSPAETGLAHTLGFAVLSSDEVRRMTPR